MKSWFCNVTRKTFKRPEKGRSQHRLRHTFEISLAERRELRISNLSGSRNADIDCDRRVASAGQRRGSHVNLVGPQRLGAWRRNQLSDPRRVSVLRSSDLSGLASGLAEPARDCRQDRGGIAGGHPYRDRRPDRMGGAGLLPPPQACFHDLLYDPLSGIHRGTIDRSGGTELGRVAVEKNLEAFLPLDLPGSKIVIGDGPQRAELQRRYPKARFLGEKTGKDLTSNL